MSEGRPLLLLFDGNALVHRAFHALPPLSVSRTGEPVNAVYGFALMLLKVLSDYKPAYCAVAFDARGPTFRHKAFEAYKAQRPRMPDELAVQFRRVRELVEAFGIPIFEVEGYEADDLLGALSHQADDQGLEAIIVTGDTDAVQLVTPHIKVLTPRTGRGAFSDTLLYDEVAVRERYGVGPKQIADFKALKGDPSDNIPGVPGIGDKTAAKLIQAFGSVEGIYGHIEEVAPDKLRELLRANEGLARQSKALATIAIDAPASLVTSRCSLGSSGRSRVVALLRELEFYSLLGKLPEAETEPGAPVAGDYRVVDTWEQFENLLADLSAAKSLVIDVETTGRDARRDALVGIALCLAPGRAHYIPMGQVLGGGLPLERALGQLKLVLEDAVEKIAHNGKWDMTVLARYGVNMRNLSFDTMVAAHLLGEKSLGLKPLAFGKLGLEMKPITDLIGTGPRQLTMAQVAVTDAAHYGCADADVTARLKPLFEEELQRDGLWKLFTEVEMPLVPVLFRMEQNGVAIDRGVLREMSQALGEQMLKLEAEIYNTVGHQFNINSPRQLGAVLFDELKLPRAKRTKSGYSTDAAVLEGLKGAHTVIEPLLQYRQVTKLKSTYVDALQELIEPATGRIHTSFDQTGTVTGRLSSSDPNLQNIPIRTEEGRRIRGAFVAQGGWRLLGADYSQIDLRVLAHLSQDPGLMAAFARDEDIHRATASQVFGVPMEKVTPDMRRVAKVVNFGVIYGMSEYGLEQATDLSREEASKFIDAYFERYQGVKAYLERTLAQARECGYVETVLGRRRRIPDLDSHNRQVRAAAERMAVNMPVQGTSADIIKVAMVKLQRRMEELGLKTMMILQVHDELLFEVPQEEMEAMKRLVLEIMPHALELSVPVKVELKEGRNWGEME